VWDCYKGHVKMAKDVPREFHEPWARAFGEVLGRVELASAAADTVALERALKWVLVIHQLLLRLGIGRRGRRSILDAMRQRFKLFEDGSMRALVALWRADVAAALAEAPHPPPDTLASVKLAVKLIEDGCVAKAMPYLEGSGLGDLELDPIKAQLRAKHPQERADWPKARVSSGPRIGLSRVRDALKDLKRNAGCGIDRFRNEFLLRLVRGEMHPAARHNVLSGWQCFAEHVVNGDLPAWFYTVWTTVVQFAPIKKEGAAPAEHDVRPVACGGSGRRAIGRCMLFEKRDALRERCEPV
jgi:hypothetical protein